MTGFFDSQASRFSRRLLMLLILKVAIFNLDLRRRDVDDLVERESARSLAPAGLLADSEPQPSASISPARAVEAAHCACAGARDLLFVKDVLDRRRLIETFAKENRAWMNRVGRRIRV